MSTNTNYDASEMGRLYRRINELLIKYNDSKSGGNLLVNITDFESIVTDAGSVLSFQNTGRSMSKSVMLNDGAEFIRPIVRRDIVTGEPKLNGDGTTRYTSLSESMECVFSCLREMQLEEDAKT